MNKIPEQPKPSQAADAREQTHTAKKNKQPKATQPGKQPTQGKQPARAKQPKQSQTQPPKQNKNVPPVSGSTVPKHGGAFEQLRSRSHLVNGIALMAIAALTALLVFSPITHSAVQNMDDTWRGIVGAAPGDSSYQWFWPVALQHGGDTLGASALCAAIVVTCLILKRWWHALYAALAMSVIAGLLVQVLKKSFGRERPGADESLGLFSSIYPVDSGSFPSGHSAAAAVLAVTLVAVVPIQWNAIRRIMPFVGVVLVASMMWQRTLTNAHWLTDTIAGAGFGAGCALLLWYAMQPKLDAEQRKHLPSGRHV